ncbi:MAG: serine/threonine-protein phosphatase, partial [Gemmatimonadales bacterium]
LRRQRFQREIELAHDLQLRLLPSPAVLKGYAQVAAICRPVDGVGGDFYSFTRLGQGRVGVMLGDVSSHGYSAALVMALVLSAAGIHAGAGGTPDQVLRAMLDSLGGELDRTDMFLSVFYGVIDPDGPPMVYANAGHPHAFRLCGRDGPQRLAPTAPPLGLAASPGVESRVIPWDREHDLLCLWTDGLVDQAGQDGFSEQRLLSELCARRDQPPEEMVREVFKVADRLTEHPADDRTLLVLRL